MTGSLRVAQVAMTALDLAATTAWYQDMFGLLPAGELRGIGGPDTAEFMGLPTCQCDIVWLADTSDFFQLEFFGFHDPVSAPSRQHPNDVGWSLIGLYVDDLDATLAKLRRAGGPVGPVLGDPPDRRVCTRDPEGVWLELRERAPIRAGRIRAVRDAPVTTAFARAVVNDFPRALRFFVDVLGLRDDTAKLHTEADERLWDGAAASTQSCVLAASGDTFQVELVKYEANVLPLPERRRICDQGFLNIAFGSRVVDDYRAVVNRLRHSEFGLHAEMLSGSARAHYVVGPDDLSVELLTIPDSATEREFGFVPLV